MPTPLPPLPDVATAADQSIADVSIHDDENRKTTIWFRPLAAEDELPPDKEVGAAVVPATDRSVDVDLAATEAAVVVEFGQDEPGEDSQAREQEDAQPLDDSLDHDIEEEEADDDEEERAAEQAAPPAEGHPANPPSLCSAPPGWLSERKHRRPLPAGIKKAGGLLLGIVGCLALGMQFLKCHAPHTTVTDERGDTVNPALVYNAQDLARRHPSSPTDFADRRPKPSRLTIQQEGQAEDVPALAFQPRTLEARQRQRQKNPEEIRERESRSGRSSIDRDKTFAPPPSRAPSALWVFGDSQEDTAKHEGRVLPATTRIDAILLRSLTVSTRSTTVVARVPGGQPLPPGTKLLGSARHGGEGVIVMQFRTAILPSGEEVQIDAEGQDREGNEGVGGRFEQQEVDSGDEPSAATGVATRAGESVLRATLGGGIVGAVAADAYDVSTDRRSQPSRRRGRSQGVVRITKGTAITAMLLKSATVPARNHNYLQ